MKKLIFILVVLMLMAPMTAVMARNAGHWGYGSGRDRAGDNYLALKFGAYMPDDEADYLDNGYYLGGALGHNVNRNFALEFGLDYTYADFDDYFDDSYVTTLGIPVTAKIVLPLSEQLDVYAGAGLGLYFTNYEFDIDGYSYDDHDTSPGVHALMGADIRMSPNAALNVEVKYTDINEDFDEDYYDDLELGGTTASIGLKFMF